MINSQNEQNTSKFLQELIIDLLLVTDGRTTDLLETLLNEKVIVQVIWQDQVAQDNTKEFGDSSGAPYYIRESVLIGEKSGFVVSHNFALVYAKYVPPALFESITHKRKGIGKAIHSLGIHSFRKIIDSGFVNEKESVDIFDKPFRLQLQDVKEKVPYKRYGMYFGSDIGIEMLEYYHPSMTNHRIMQEIN